MEQRFSAAHGEATAEKSVPIQTIAAHELHHIRTPNAAQAGVHIRADGIGLRMLQSTE